MDSDFSLRRYFRTSEETCTLCMGGHGDTKPIKRKSKIISNSGVRHNFDFR